MSGVLKIKGGTVKGRLLTCQVPLSTVEKHEDQDLTLALVPGTPLVT